MKISDMVRLTIVAVAALALAACENLPGTRTEQTTGVGAAAGAAIGAAAMENDLVGALLGGAAGAAGGYLVGARTDWFGEDSDETSAAAREAVEDARESPATAADVGGDDDADLNEDGFVTMDELIAMEDADLTDQEILDRLEATDQVFELSDDQRERLIDAGLSEALVASVEDVNREERDAVLEDREVISRRAS